MFTLTCIFGVVTVLAYFGALAFDTHSSGLAANCRLICFAALLLFLGAGARYVTSDAPEVESKRAGYNQLLDALDNKK
jgi:hypothetical protein